MYAILTNGSVCVLVQVNMYTCIFSPPLRRLCGSLGYYDTSKEKKISLKTPHTLQVYDRVFHKVTTTDDPVIREVGYN